MFDAGGFDEESSRIVIDHGSNSIKAGIAGEDHPLVIVPTVIGRPRHSTINSDVSTQQYYIGNEARIRKESVSIQYPMEHGIVTNWDDMERIWHHLFVRELRIVPEEHPILFTETPLNPKGNREKMAQILFEKFNVPAMYVALQSLLAFYAMGRTSGMILDIGDGTTHTLPVIEGYSVPRAIQRLDIGGRDLTDRMVNLLMERGFCFASTAGREIVREMKEQHTYVALDFEQESKRTERSIAEKYKLPSGEMITLSHERFKCPEALFQPQMLNYHGPGIAALLYDSTMKCDSDFRKDLCCNFILSGGSTMFPGLVDRMQKEMQGLFPSGIRSRFVASPERNIAAWIGGSILCSLSTFQRQWVSKKDYEEYGPSIVHQKCI